MTTSTNIVDAEGVSKPVLILNEQPILSLSAGGGVVKLRRLTMQFAAIPLNAEDHRVLAGIWDNDEDDTIFADQPAI